MGGRRHSPGDLGSVSVPLCGPAVPRHRSPRGPGDVPLLLQTANGNVEAKVVCFYRRRDISSTLIALADKHASESSLPGRPPCPPRGQLSAPGGLAFPPLRSLGLLCWVVSHVVTATLWPGPGHESVCALPLPFSGKWVLVCACHPEGSGTVTA